MIFARYMVRRSSSAALKQAQSSVVRAFISVDTVEASTGPQCCSCNAQPQIFKSPTLGGLIEQGPHGYAETREAAMAAFAKSWRRE